MRLHICVVMSEIEWNTYVPREGMGRDGKGWKGRRKTRTSEKCHVQYTGSTVHTVLLKHEGR